MKNNKIMILSCCLLLGGATNVFSQSGTVATGGEATGTNGKLSFSLGQTDYRIVSGTGGSMRQGIQQPFEIKVVSGAEQTDIHLSASVYPNPTLDFVTLSFEGADIKNMSYKLFDLEGRIITQQIIDKNQSIISMTGSANGVYFIKVFKNNSEIKVFKIIKNQ